MENLDTALVLFRCTACGLEENISEKVVDHFDNMDGGDSLIPPRFGCTKCSGHMQPIYYVNHDGIVYN